MERLRANLEKYDLSTEGLADRVIVVCGDIAKPLLGLSQETYDRLAEETQVVYNNGAAVHFGLPYETVRQPNVVGTRSLLEFACTGRTKAFHHVSSISVFTGAAYPDGTTIPEDEPLDFAKAPLEAYSRSKWAAEALVAEAGRRGLPVAIYRPGRITGHSETGSANVGDLVYRTLLGSIRAGAAPDLEMLVDMTPVDYVAKALVHLSLRQPADGRAYHLVSPNPARLETVADWVRKMGASLETMGLHEWRARLAADEDNELAGLLAMFAEGELPPEIFEPYFASDRTQAILAEAGIYCPPFGPDLLRKYVGAVADRNRNGRSSEATAGS
jgi:thioester reductase-like protein